MAIARATSPAPSRSSKKSPPAVATGPLTLGERQLIERALHAERARALRTAESLSATLSGGGQPSSGQGDVVDQSSALIDREQASMLATRGHELLRELDGALDRLRLAPETFNCCDVCASRIPFGRLELLPTTRTCVSHGTRQG